MTKAGRMVRINVNHRMPTIRQIGYFITDITMIFGGFYFLQRQQRQLELLNGREPLMLAKVQTGAKCTQLFMKYAGDTRTTK